MNKKGMLLATFLVLVIALGMSVAADVDHEHDAEHEIKTVNGYEIELLTEPETPEIGEVHLIAHIEGENSSGLHVEIQVAKMEMHAGEMEEHIVLDFEDGHAHEDEPGHYAIHYTFEEEGTYMIRVKIEDVGTTDAFHITVASSFHKGELTMPLIFVTVGIGAAALMLVWTKKGGA
jgi:hypothetical protein